MALGSNIRARRMARAMSQEQLAEASGVSRQTVAKWEAGETSPNLEYAGALAAALDVSLDQLISFEERAVGAPMPPRGKHLFGTVTVGERGQIVVPKAARDLFDWPPGTSLVVLGDESQGLALMRADEFMSTLNALIDRVGADATASR